MKIAVDVMGGDFAPDELILGAQSYLKEGSAELLLVGDENKIRKIMKDIPEGCSIVHTSEYIEMGESPLKALRKKKNASIAVAARLVKEGKAVALISAGSTGAQMAASLLEIGRIKGVDRPAISVLLPTVKEHGVMLLDVGANVDCKPRHLLQFALMGSAYYEKVCEIENPKIGLLNIGEEPAKGNELSKATYKMLSESSLNFVGNIEADGLYTGKAHVVVCDGFVGNILLKASESVSEVIRGGLFKAALSSGMSKEHIAGLKSGVKKFNPDSPEYSAAPLLGINGVSVVCHGKSKSNVIANAIKLAESYASHDVIDLISNKIADMPNTFVD